MLERFGAGHDRASRELPAWARWSTAPAARPWTVGVEEELMLLDARTSSVANRIDDVLAAVPRRLTAHLSAETHACVAELKTAAHATVPEVAAELTWLRKSLDGALRERLGLCAGGAGTHPLAMGSEVAVATTERYRKIDATMRALARREPTMALHVHVAAPDGTSAVRALNGLRGELPLLLALSANSPFWRGTDSGFASIRTPIFAMFPRVGIPRAFPSYRAYVRLVDAMLSSGAIPDAGHLWWDARLQPRLGTVEVRIMDAQSRVADVAVHTALVQCLVRRHAAAPPARVADPEVLAENRFLAARDGMSAQLIDSSGGPGRRRPAADALADMLERCRPVADALGCAAELEAAGALAADVGYGRQRLVAARDGITAVPAWLAAEFAPARRLSGPRA